MNYSESEKGLARSLYIGNEIELVAPLADAENDLDSVPCKPLDESQIKWISAWLAGEGWAQYD